MPARLQGSRRRATLVTWYHEPKDRCVMITLVRKRCRHSATFVDETGRIKVCKIHRDLMPDVHFSKIPTRIVDISEE